MALRRKPYDLRGETVSDVTLDFEPYVSSVDCPLNPTAGCDMVGFFIDYFAAAASMANFRYFQGIGHQLQDGPFARIVWLG